MRPRFRAEVLFLAAVLAVLRAQGLTGDAPAWALVALLAPLLVAPRRQGVARQPHPEPPGGWHWLIAAGFVGYAAAFGYLLGWGPVCVPGLAVAVVLDLEMWGPRFTRRMLGLTVVAVAIGQLAVGQGWVHSYLSFKESNAAAVLGLLTVMFIGLTLERGARREARVEASLDSSGERFRILAESSPVGIAELGPDTSMMYANQRLWEILGVPPETDPVGFDYRAHLPAETIDRLATATLKGDHDGVDVPFFRAGESRWMRVRIAPIGERGGYVVTVADVTAAARVREALTREARHDDLTGLRNRGSFLSSLSHAAGNLPSAGPHALVFIDLDRFKQVNDAHGHAAGDALLAEAAARVAAVARSDDVVGRLGGDEFGALLWGADRQTATTIAERIVHDLNQPFNVEGVEARVGVSIGVVLLHEAGLQADALMRDADVAMYRAKARSGGYEIVAPSRAVAPIR